MDALTLTRFTDLTRDDLPLVLLPSSVLTSQWQTRIPCPELAPYLENWQQTLQNLRLEFQVRTGELQVRDQKEGDSQMMIKFCPDSARLVLSIEVYLNDDSIVEFRTPEFSEPNYGYTLIKEMVRTEFAYDIGSRPLPPISEETSGSKYFLLLWTRLIASGGSISTRKLMEETVEANPSLSYVSLISSYPEN